MSLAVFPTPGEIYELAQQARSRGDFRREVLIRLRSCVGFEAAFFHQVTPGPLDKRTVLGCPESMLPTSRGEYMRRYTSSFAPIFGELRQHSVVVDSEMFGLRALHEQPYFADILLPIGLSQCVYSAVQFRDQAPALITLARDRVRALPHSTRAHMTALLPVIALADGGLSAYDEEPSGTDLTTKQKELLRYVRTGLGNKDIAQLLGISPNTVRNRLAALFEQFGVRTRTELVLLASRGPQETAHI